LAKAADAKFNSLVKDLKVLAAIGHGPVLFSSTVDETGKSVFAGLVVCRITWKETHTT